MKQHIIFLGVFLFGINSFGAYSNNVICDYLENEKWDYSTNITLVGEQISDDTISLDKLLNIAVKYFFIRDINPNGYYVIKLCGGINGIKQTEKVRNHKLETFCFSVISSHFEDGQYNLYDEFVKGVKEVYTLNLGIEKEERLLLAQGALYMYMRNNETLKKLLLAEYEKQKNELSFVLRNE